MAFLRSLWVALMNTAIFRRRRRAVTFTVPTSLTVSPSSPSVVIGRQTQLIARNQLGQQVTGGLTWASSAPANATITNGGVVTGVAAGSATFTATYNPGAIAGSTSAITVAAQTLQTAALTTAPTSAVVTHTVTYQATGYDQTGQPMTAQPTFTYASGTPATATINTSTGVVTGVAAGTSSITATSGAVTTPGVTLTVAAQVASAVSVSPSTFAIDDLSTQQLTAPVTDQAGGTISSPTVTWGSNAPSTASVNSSGLVTGQSAGSVVITATSGSASGTSTGTITHATGGLNPSTGQNVMGATSTAVPTLWDAARVYSGAGYASPDAQWRALKLANNDISSPTQNWIFSDTTKNGGQPNATAMYSDGMFVDLVSVVAASACVGGIPAFRFRWPGNDGHADQPAGGQLMSLRLPTARRVWLGRRIVHLTAAQLAGAHAWDPSGSDCASAVSQAYNNGGTVSNQFTLTNAVTLSASPQTVLVSNTNNLSTASSITVDTAGSAETISGVTVVDATHLTAIFTKSHAAGTPVAITYGGVGHGFKSGPFIGSPSVESMRVGIEPSNFTMNGAGHPDGLNAAVAGWTVDSGANFVGVNDTNVSDTATLDAMYWDGLTYDEVILGEQVTGSDTHDYSAIRFWHRLVNANGSVGPWYAASPYMLNTMQSGAGYHDGYTFNSIEFTSKNHNAAIGNDRYRDIAEWAAFNADNPNTDGSNDPWGILAADRAHAPAVPGAPSVVSQTPTTAVLSLTLVPDSFTRSYITTLRPVIDGVDLPAQDYTLKPEEGDHRGSPGATVIQVPVTFAAGSVHTIGFKGVNGAGTLASVVSATTTAGASGGITLVNSQTATGGSGSGPVSAPAIAITAGNLIVVTISEATGGGPATTVSDTSGNVYTQVASRQEVSTAPWWITQVWYAKNAIADAANVVTVTDAGTSNKTINVFQYAGASTTAPLDTSVNASGGATGAVTTPAFTTTTANELILVAAKNSGSGTLTAAGYALRTASGHYVFEKSVTTIQTAQTATVTSTGGTDDIGAVLATFK